MLGLLINSFRRTHVVPGVLPLLMLALWAVPCAVALDSGLRAVGFLMRASLLFSAAVTLLYIINARKSISVNSILGGLCIIWVTVIAGGYLGMALPYGRLTTPVGLLMPGGIIQNDLVRDLVFPPFAEVQTPWGAPHPYIRPSAPFPYSNGWGMGIALLTPIAIATALRSRRKLIRVAIIVGLLASIVPAVATLNRGMLLILSVSLAYVSLTLAVRGRLLPLLGLLAGLTVVLGLVTQLGLVQGIEERQSYSDTTSGRASIYIATFEAVMKSPIVGFGAPRPNEDIGINLGTQGAAWMMLFSYGFVGLALFLTFLGNVLIRTQSITRDDSYLWLHSSLLGALVGSFFYGFDTTQWLIVASLSGVLLRRRYPIREDQPRAQLGSVVPEARLLDAGGVP